MICTEKKVLDIKKQKKNFRNEFGTTRLSRNDSRWSEETFPSTVVYKKVPTDSQFGNKSTLLSQVLSLEKIQL